jgi:hypothetical protein
VKTYREAIAVGKKFIEETQQLLLRTNQVQSGKVLDQKSVFEHE